MNKEGEKTRILFQGLLFNDRQAAAGFQDSQKRKQTETLCSAPDDFVQQTTTTKNKRSHSEGGRMKNDFAGYKKTNVLCKSVEGRERSDSVQVVN